jgi:chorismate mutase
MAPNSPSLDELRLRIDQLDDELHDVLMRRAEVVEAVGQLKKAESTPALRPGREAKILRRLVARHHGGFPRPILVRLWRELLSGTIAMQAEIPIAVHTPAASSGLWDLARDHYGSHTPLAGFRAVGEVVGAVSDGRATLGILPVPGQSDGEAWWRHLLPGDLPKPRIIARLPFGARGNARPEGGDALVIGKIEPESSDDDRSLFAIETGAEVSRTRVTTALGQVGIAATLLEGTGAGDLAAQLFEYEGWLAGDDPRLKELQAAFAPVPVRVALLGAYARPLAASVLAGAG